MHELRRVVGGGGGRGKNRKEKSFSPSLYPLVSATLRLVLTRKGVSPIDFAEILKQNGGEIQDQKYKHKMSKLGQDWRTQ